MMRTVQPAGLSSAFLNPDDRHLPAVFLYYCFVGRSGGRLRSYRLGIEPWQDIGLGWIDFGKEQIFGFAIFSPTIKANRAGQDHNSSLLYKCPPKDGGVDC